MMPTPVEMTPELQKRLNEIAAGLEKKAKEDSLRLPPEDLDSRAQTLEVIDDTFEQTNDGIREHEPNLQREPEDKNALRYKVCSSFSLPSHTAEIVVTLKSKAENLTLFFSPNDCFEMEQQLAKARINCENMVALNRGEAKLVKAEKVVPAPTEEVKS